MKTKNKNENGYTLMEIIIIGLFLLVLAISAVSLYVIYHFIAKHW